MMFQINYYCFALVNQLHSTYHFLIAVKRSTFLCMNNYIYSILFIISTVYYDVNLLVPNVNFVNLLSFDKKTPLRNPSLADIPAPIQEDFSGVAADSVVNDVK